ncbi:MAG: hypothetical protein J6I64_08145, partial [Lachnospiraceae bacterium]|nr:hypothetical protein [Lachnospiraceae bacterium]
FDTSWATNDFEKQIGQPVFENWEVKEYVEGSSWTMFVKGVHYETVKEYAGSLQSYGFAVNIDENDGFDGLAYIYKADNASGYHCRLVFEAVSADGNGNFMLEISKGE